LIVLKNLKTSYLKTSSNVFDVRHVSPCQLLVLLDFVGYDACRWLKIFLLFSHVFFAFLKIGIYIQYLIIY
jgi:hypothetical protein